MNKSNVFKSIRNNQSYVIISDCCVDNNAIKDLVAIPQLKGLGIIDCVINANQIPAVTECPNLMLDELSFAGSKFEYKELVGLMIQLVNPRILTLYDTNLSIDYVKGLSRAFGAISIRYEPA